MLLCYKIQQQTSKISKKECSKVKNKKYKIKPGSSLSFKRLELIGLSCKEMKLKTAYIHHIVPIIQQPRLISLKRNDMMKHVNF